MDTAKTLEKAIVEKLTLTLGASTEEATAAQMLQACALVLRDEMVRREMQSRKNTRQEAKKQVHYLSLEFLMGRSLMKNAYNLGLMPQLRQALDSLGFKAADVLDAEPDAGLGNGGLGRLAACYLDAMTTLDIPATGYSICYDLGLFRQQIEDGEQVELPDEWKDVGGAWLLRREQETETVVFGGKLRQFWAEGHLHVVNEGGVRVLAVPCDMEIAGFATERVNTLRLWEPRSAASLNMELFSRGQYLEAGREAILAETIGKVLYPEDNHPQGKELRLKQQYFFVSATAQSIVRKHLQAYGSLDNFHEKNVIQVNDTHPALIIPELIRIFIDDVGLSWDVAWETVKKTVAYTNHTVLAEALERWPQQLMAELLPRIWEILQEISARWERQVLEFYQDQGKLREMGVIWGGEVRMANLCIAGGMAVNGVSALHSDILRREVFKGACDMEPGKFRNVTNGVDHRRWLSEINPGLDGLIRELTGGDGYLTQPQRLRELDAYAEDSRVLQRLDEIKAENKAAFVNALHKTQGVLLNPYAIFDVQAKRLHEYKRQLLNVLHILYLYRRLREDPNAVIRPRCFLFGAKAAPGYAVAKRIIRLINSLADQIESDPLCRDKLQVVFLENYRVSLAEKLMPASEVSQQISTAGKEASGTGNMKFMMNGALTIGTLDGANVEMHEVLGDENMFLFGLRTEELARMRQEGYQPQLFCQRDPLLAGVLEELKKGFRDGVSYEDIYQLLLGRDEYFLLADFAEYCAADERMAKAYGERNQWNRMSLHNIARSGIFAADRAVGNYADDIWKVAHK